MNLQAGFRVWSLYPLRLQVYKEHPLGREKSEKLGPTVDDIYPALPIINNIYHNSHSFRVLKVAQDLYHQQ